LVLGETFDQKEMDKLFDEFLEWFYDETDEKEKVISKEEIYESCCYY
jgi:hypothetical protein